MESNGSSGDYFLGSGGVKRIGRRVKRSKEESAGTLAQKRHCFSIPSYYLS